MTPGQQLADQLAPISRPQTSFFAAGQYLSPAPLLSVSGVGPVAFPLLPIQLQALIAASEQAPYGRGPKTLVDTAVRRCWQIDAAKLSVQGAHWEALLAQTVQAVMERLDVRGTVHAELYKMLLYEEGGFFTFHRDSEKTPGMFATLVFVLPAAHTGGELVVQHAGQEVLLPLQPESPVHISYAAFYADCQHELRPVTSGQRLCLVYNLVSHDPTPPRPPDQSQEIQRLTALLRGWGEGWPDKLCCLLEHNYTAQGLTFARLKGADAARAAALTQATKEADCSLHVGLISIREAGGADYTGRWGWESDNPKDWEIYEDTVERTVSVELLEASDGAAVLFKKIEADEAHELSPPLSLDSEDFDEVRFWEASGNAGGTFERSYRRAALVIWPSRRFLAVGQRLERGYDDEAAATMLRTRHPLALHFAQQCLQKGRASQTLSEQILASGEVVLVREILRHLAKSRWNESLSADTPRILACIKILPVAESEPMLRLLLENNREKHPAACAKLLRQTLDVLGDSEVGAACLGALIRELVLWLQQRPAEAHAVHADVAADLLAAGLQILTDAELDALVSGMLEHPRRWALEGTLLRALLQLIDDFGEELIGVPAIERLRRACEVPVRARVAVELSPPPGHVALERFRPHCADCGALRAFLVDPWALQWSLKATKARRLHLEEMLRVTRLDVRCETVQEGNPHTLIVHKTPDNYERRAAQRAADLKTLACLSLLDDAEE